MAAFGLFDRDCTTFAEEQTANIRFASSKANKTSESRPSFSFSQFKVLRGFPCRAVSISAGRAMYTENLSRSMRIRRSFLFSRRRWKLKGVIRRQTSDTAKQDSYAISKPIRKQNRDERLEFTLGRGMCLGFNRISCSSSLDRSMRWTQNSSFGSSGTSLRPETLYSCNPKVRQLTGSQTHKIQMCEPEDE